MPVCRPRLFARFFARFIAVLCLLPAVLAQAAGEGHVRALREHTTIRINADHTYEQVIDFTWRAIDQAGAASLGQQYLSYNTARQSLDVLEAETVPASGAPVKLTAADIKVQDGVLGGVSFPEQKLLQLTFPKLAAGDAIRLRYRLRQNLLDLPGGMSHMLFLREDVIRDDSRVTIHYPAALPLQVAVNKLQPQSAPDAGDNGAERTRDWTYRNTDTVTPEPNTVNGWQHTPYLMLSTFADWKAVADAYQRGAAPKAAVTPAISALAAQIVGAATSERQQSELLYDWVRKNIRYVASYVGNGGWVPNDAASVLQNRYGDCKDHAALLEALLEARGIASSQVLLMADRDNYVLPPIPAMWFNHAISYIPSLGLFLDSTDATMPFGLLPEADADKQALVTRDFSAPMRTPQAGAAALRVERRVRIKLAADGSAQRSTDITGYGLSAVSLRQFMDSIGRGKEGDWVKRTLTSNGYEGDGSLELLPAAPDGALALRYVERIRNYLSQPEAGVLPFVPGLGGPVALNGIVNRFNEPQRSRDARCENLNVHDVIEIELAPEMQVLYVPKDLTLDSAGLHFDARYERVGANGYRLTRSVNADAARAWCSPEQYQVLRPLMNRIGKALNARLVFVGADGDGNAPQAGAALPPTPVTRLAAHAGGAHAP